MMGYIIDTHAFLWFVNNDPQLSQAALSIISNASNRRFLSMASVWELAIKINTGKISLNQSLERFIREQCRKTEIKILPIRNGHIYPLASLSLYHRDPFDRMIVSQSKITGYAVVSTDKLLDNYGIQRLW
jgi:PIN domain nuclease of toxin-antitoxin system